MAVLTTDCLPLALCVCVCVCMCTCVCMYVCMCACAWLCRCVCTSLIFSFIHCFYWQKMTFVVKCTFNTEDADQRKQTFTTLCVYTKKKINSDLKTQDGGKPVGWFIYFNWPAYKLHYVSLSQLWVKHLQMFPSHLQHT